ncbi:hypothetical protein [Pseudomonas aeruginosa]|uniref:hypothetical protein n=1 Tax=Pseudomonas aeruginosa TaxID=287 RepID=UPI0011869F28|nr:hypothetical protein [Pseudomonas aeruginosa]
MLGAAGAGGHPLDVIEVDVLHQLLAGRAGRIRGTRSSAPPAPMATCRSDRGRRAPPAARRPGRTDPRHQVFGAAGADGHPLDVIEGDGLNQLLAGRSGRIRGTWSSAPPAPMATCRS